MTHDFTFKKYEELCQALSENNYSIISFLEYLESRNLYDYYAVLRHDIDRKPYNALKMAELEYNLGVSSTYYFRYPYTFNYNVIRKIFDLGHEIGYHYEVLSKANGDYEKGIILFREELKKFKSVCDIFTICMHGSPLSKYDNRDLWKRYDFKDYGIIGEAYLSVDNDISYFSDTGRNWNKKNKIRDFLATDIEVTNINKTDELIKLIERMCVSHFYILVHSERWASNSAEWINYYIKDLCFNLGKKALRGIK